MTVDNELIHKEWVNPKRMYVFVYTEFAAQFDHFATHFIIRHPFILVCKSKNVRTGQISISTMYNIYILIKKNILEALGSGVE